MITLIPKKERESTFYILSKLIYILYFIKLTASGLRGEKPLADNEQCRQGKSARRIRNFGRRIGFCGARKVEARGSNEGARSSSDWPPLGGAGPCAGRVLEDESGLVAAGCAPGKNCNGQRESDCLIKTELCDGRRPVLTQRDFCPVL